jgi:hypothetical protein
VNVLLLIGKTSTSHEAVAAEADDLRRAGHRVTLGTRVPPLPVLADAVDVVVLLSPALPAPVPAAPVPAAPAAASADEVVPVVATPATPSTAGSARAGGLVGTARRRVRRLRGQVSGAVTEPARSWRSVRRSDAVLALAREADVVVAVDAPMVRAAWHLGQKLPLPQGPEVVYGLPATASALARRATR